jgi:phosphoribosylformylglycinamidine synthase
MPFISGKDSLKNEYHSGERHLVIPPTLLISAMGQVPDVRLCVSMDLKAPGNHLYLLGMTRRELGGSHYNLVHQLQGGTPPRMDTAMAPRIFRTLFTAIQRKLLRSCHDLSEGGLAVALAEMAFAGGIGAQVKLSPSLDLSDVELLFAESTTRFLVEVEPQRAQEFETLVSNLPFQRVGVTIPDPWLHLVNKDGVDLIKASLRELKEAWQAPLRW